MVTMAAAAGPSSRLGRVSRHFLRTPSLLAGAVLLLAIAGLAIVAPWTAPYNPVEQDLTRQLLRPSPAHLFGTDEFGRDIFSRILYGARIALVVGILADGTAAILGVLLGLVAGFFGRWVDVAVMRSVDVLLAFPYLLLAMIVITVLGPGLLSTTLAIGIVHTPQFARLVRGTVLSLREQDFVEAARALGATTPRMLGRHIVPNILSPIVVMASLTIGFTITETAGLSFLGLGASPPTPEWGSMLATGRSFMLTAPWIATFPGLAVFVTVVGFNLVGDGLRDLLDPRLRGQF